MRMRALRVVAAWALTMGILGSLAVPAASQGTPTGDAPPQATQRDPRRPGDHRAEQEYAASLRQAPPGISPAQARAIAVQRTQQLPQAATVPGATGGARPAVGGRQPNGMVAPAGVWQQLGPAPENSDTTNPALDYQYGFVSGRATSLVVGPNTGVLYLGTAGGGVWKSATDGADWRPLTDFLPSLAIGALALDPADTTDRTLYVGTGEANNASDNYAGVGVYKTVDGGENWSLLGQSTFGAYGANAKRFSAMAANGLTVFGATKTGLFQSGDGGANWSLVTVASGFPNAPVTDVIIDGTTVYVVVSSPTAGLSYGGVYKSTTGGGSGSFTLMNSGLPAATSWHRAQIGIARSNTQVLYITIANTADALFGVYKTTNGGTSWTATATQPPDYFSFGDAEEGGTAYEGADAGQGWYDIYITVDPTNENFVYSGGISMVASSNGGGTWSKIGDVYCGGVNPPCHGPIHPDQHAGAFGRTGSPRPFYAANDGGIYKTTNPTVPTPTWTSLNANLATTQFYAGDTTANYLTQPIVIAGTQDNGTVRSISPALGGWNAIHGGDGAFVGIDRANTEHVYTEYANGFFYSTTNASAGSAINWTDRTPSCQALGVLFINPFVVDPANGDSILYGAFGKTCKSLDGGVTWVQETVASSVYMRSLAMEAGNTDTRYAGTTLNVYRTMNGNIAGASTWAICGTGLPTSSGVNRVISLTAATGGIAYATLSGFGVHHVWKSTNCGAWQDISGNLPDVPTTSLVQYATNGGGTALIVGTDVGVFLSTNGGTTWSTLMSGLPNTPIDQLITDGALTTLFAITHGRGVWRVDIPGDFSVANLSPSSGTTSGGNVVTIRGTGFTAGMSATFDGLSATNVFVVSGTELRVNAPPHAVGVVAVQVTLGTTTLTVPGSYQYGMVNPAPPPRSPTIGSGAGPAPPPRPTAPPSIEINTPNAAPVRR